MIVDSAINLGTAFLQLLKKMSLKDFILILLLLTTVSFAWANNGNKNDAIEARSNLEKYKTEVEAKKYDDKINSLTTDKYYLKDQLKKNNKQRLLYQEEAVKWKKEFEKLQGSQPDKTKIKKDMNKLNGAKGVCDELKKYNVNCFIYSSD